LIFIYFYPSECPKLWICHIVVIVNSTAKMAPMNWTALVGII